MLAGWESSELRESRSESARESARQFYFFGVWESFLSPKRLKSSRLIRYEARGKYLILLVVPQPSRSNRSNASEGVGNHNKASAWASTAFYKFGSSSVTVFLRHHWTKNFEVFLQYVCVYIYIYIHIIFSTSHVFPNILFIDCGAAAVCCEERHGQSELFVVRREFAQVKVWVYLPHLYTQLTGCREGF
jgi:hypothetical protein